MLGDASIAGRRYVERQWSGTKKNTYLSKDETEQK